MNKDSLCYLEKEKEGWQTEMAWEKRCRTTSKTTITKSIRDKTWHVEDRKPIRVCIIQVRAQVYALAYFRMHA